jgi:hypothetical protein
MKKAVFSICALALAVPAIASAHDTTYESTVSIDYAVEPPAKGASETLMVGGRVGSEKEACVANRTVKLYALFNLPEKRGEFTKELVDVDRTSRNGAWSGTGNFIGTDGALAKLVRKDIGPKGHNHVCGAASDVDVGS